MPSKYFDTQEELRETRIPLNELHPLMTTSISKFISSIEKTHVIKPCKKKENFVEDEKPSHFPGRRYHLLLRTLANALSKERHCISKQLFMIK